MAARSLWKGAISFGLVNIPVKLFSAVQDSTLDLDMLDKRDLGRIRFVRINENTQKEVPYGDIVKGYNLDGEYVVLSDEDFKAAAKQKSDSLDILDFVDEDSIDRMYFEQPYYLEPEKGGAKSYALLREAMVADNKMGVVLFVLRNKEHLGVLRVSGKVIVLCQLRFAEEIRDPSDLSVPAKDEVKPKELEMARKLIDQTESDFDLAAYKDTYKDDLLRIIEAKAKGVKIKAGAAPKRKAVSSDLMSQLMASLNKISNKAKTPVEKAGKTIAKRSAKHVKAKPSKKPAARKKVA